MHMYIVYVDIKKVCVILYKHFAHFDVLTSIRGFGDLKIIAMILRLFINKID